MNRPKRDRAGMERKLAKRQAAWRELVRSRRQAQKAKGRAQVFVT